MKRLLSLVAVAVGTSLLASGCSSPTGSVAASVNGTELSRADLDDQLNAIAENGKLVQSAEAAGFEITPTDGGFSAVLTADWLTLWVQQATVDAEFERRDLLLTDADRDLAESLAARTFGNDSAVFAAFPEWFRDDMIDAFARRVVLSGALTAEVEPTEAELLQIYDANRDVFCPSGKLVSHVLVDTPEAAAAIEAELAGGAEFAELARTRSSDTGSAPVGGVLTCIDSQGWSQYDPAFQQGAVALAVGAVSEPVQTQFGYHVIKVTDFSFENARPFLEAAVQQQDPVPAFVARKTAKSDVTVDPRYGRVVSDAQGTRIEPPATPEPRTRPAFGTTTTAVPLQGGSPEGPVGGTGSP